MSILGVFIHNGTEYDCLIYRFVSFLSVTLSLSCKKPFQHPVHDAVSYLWLPTLRFSTEKKLIAFATARIRACGQFLFFQNFFIGHVTISNSFEKRNTVHVRCGFSLLLFDASHALQRPGTEKQKEKERRSVAAFKSCPVNTRAETKLGHLLEFRQQRKHRPNLT